MDQELQPHRGGVILALGIVGLMTCPVVSIIAWVLGNSDLALMDAGEMDPEGRATTQAGKIIGMISVGLTAFLILFYVGGFVILVLLGAAAGTAGG
jgi:hypothetical protein